MQQKQLKVEPDNNEYFEYGYPDSDKVIFLCGGIHGDEANGSICNL